MSLGEVTVVAPSVCHSIKGHAVTGDHPIEVTRQSTDGLGEVWVATGTPADCARLGLLELVDGGVDVVMSGINRGGNLGVDVYYSGTVAAAREAAFMGVPAIAISQFVRKGVPPDWEWTQRVAESAVRRILDAPVPPGCMWNINLPAVQTGQWPKSLSFAPISTDAQDVRYRFDGTAADGKRRYSFCGRYPDRPARAETDVGLVFDGHAVATLLQVQTTAAQTATPTTEPFPGEEE